jgi:hypothetical protein
MGGLLPARIPMAPTLLPLHAMLCRVLGGMGSAPCLVPSSRSVLPPRHALELLPTPRGGSSTLRITPMAGATTILDKHLPATSMGGLCPQTACSPVMGGTTFLLGTCTPLFTGVVLFPITLVHFHVHLNRLPQAMVFLACCCAIL